MTRWKSRNSAPSGRKRRRTSPSLDEEGRLRAIMEAALRAFARQGFAQTPVAEVAAAAGVASGTVIYHFQTKENLLSVLAWECLHLLHRRCSLAMAAVAPGPDRVRAYVNAFFDYLGEEPDRLLLLLKTRPMELARAPSAPGLDIQTLWQSCRRLLVDGFREAAEAVSGDPEQMAASLLAHLSGSAWLHLFFAEDLERLRASVLQVALFADADPGRS